MECSWNHCRREKHGQHDANKVSAVYVARCDSMSRSQITRLALFFFVRAGASLPTGQLDYRQDSTSIEEVRHSVACTAGACATDDWQSWSGISGSRYLGLEVACSAAAAFEKSRCKMQGSGEMLGTLEAIVHIGIFTAVSCINTSNLRESAIAVAMTVPSFQMLVKNGHGTGPFCKRRRGEGWMMRTRYPGRIFVFGKSSSQSV